MLNLTREERLVIVFLLFSFGKVLVTSFQRKEVTNDAKESPRPRVNINTAGFSELIKLKGVGKKTALRIIDHRDDEGPFFYPEDIMKVKGIGDGKFELIKKDIFVE